MQDKLTNYILLTASFFPVFIFRSGLSFFEILSFFFISILLIFFINYFFFQFSNKEINFNNKFVVFYFSVIICISIDSNIGLWNGIIIPFGNYLRGKELLIFSFLKNYYILSFELLLILTFFVYFIVFNFGRNVLKIFTVFIITIFLFNYFDTTKSYKKIPSFDNRLPNQPVLSQNNLVLILDEMSGINSMESSHPSGKEFVEKANIFFKKFDFLTFTNSSSVSYESHESLAAMLNYKESVEFKHEQIRRSKNFFVVHDVIQNKIFDKYKNISVFQNFNINYCNHPNVTKCDQYNPFKNKNFINGYKNTKITKYFSIWQINGSILSKFFGKLLSQIRLIDSALPPEGEKASFENLLVKTHKDIKSNNFDLIFVHTLVPHTPYGYNDKCIYDGELKNLNTFLQEEKKIIQHNIERICMLEYLTIFFENLKYDGLFDKLKIIVMSDHGSRINSADNSSLSTIFSYRNKNTKFKIDKSIKTIQQLFGQYL